MTEEQARELLAWIDSEPEWSGELLLLDWMDTPLVKTPEQRVVGFVAVPEEYYTVQDLLRMLAELVLSPYKGGNGYG